MKALLCLLLAGSCVSGETYVFGFLRMHPERQPLPKEQAEATQKAHLAHLDTMAKAGLLIGAGPLANSKDLRGVLIFKDMPLDKANAMASEDQAAKGKLLYSYLEKMEGPAGIGAAIADKVKSGATDYKMTRYGLVVYWRQPGTAPSSDSVQQWRKSMLSGKAAMFGDFPEAKELASVAVWRTTDLEEVRALIAEDPAVKAGVVRPEAFVWMVAEGVIP